MGNGKPEIDETATERKLRGFAKTRNPDTELHIDGEEDTVISDGLDVGDDSETLSGTRGNSPGTMTP